MAATGLCASSSARDVYVPLVWTIFLLSLSRSRMERAVLVLCICPIIPVARATLLVSPMAVEHVLVIEMDQVETTESEKRSPKKTF